MQFYIRGCVCENMRAVLCDPTRVNADRFPRLKKKTKITLGEGVKLVDYQAFAGSEAFAGVTIVFYYLRNNRITTYYRFDFLIVCSSHAYSIQ